MGIVNIRISYSGMSMKISELSSSSLNSFPNHIPKTLYLMLHSKRILLPLLIFTLVFFILHSQNVNAFGTKDKYQVKKEEQKGIHDGYQAGEAAKEKLKHGGHKIMEGARKLGHQLKKGAKEKANDVKDFVHAHSHEEEPQVHGYHPSVMESMRDVKKEPHMHQTHPYATPEAYSTIGVQTTEQDIGMPGTDIDLSKASDTIRNKAQEKLEDLKDSGSKIGENLKEKGEKVAHGMEKVKDKVSEKIYDAKEYVKEKVEDVKDKAADVKDQVVDKSQDLKSEAEDVKEEIVEKKKGICGRFKGFFCAIHHKAMGVKHSLDSTVAGFFGKLG